MAPITGISLQISATLCDGGPDGLWPELEPRLQERGVPCSVIKQTALSSPPLLGQPGASGAAGRQPVWAYLESDFLYAPHRISCREAAAGVHAEDIGTRFPLVLLFEQQDFLLAGGGAAALAPFVAWLRSPPRPFGEDVRILLVLLAGSRRRPASLEPSGADTLARCLVTHGIGCVDVCDADHAAGYVIQCAASVAEARKRRTPSRFKVAGMKCQTLPRDEQDKIRITWVSQLMQVAGVSEEIAKAIAGKHPSPGALLQAVARASVAQGTGGFTDVSSSVAENFLADLEYPIRGKKGTRRLGPIVSRRLFTLFHPGTPPDYLLI